MKKLKRLALTASMLSALLAVSGCDKGSVFNGIQAKTDATTRIESAGWDMRVYEFTPETAEYMQCIFVAGTKKGGLFCFEKRDS